jgi:hypothetical protein
MILIVLSIFLLNFINASSVTFSEDQVEPFFDKLYHAYLHQNLKGHISKKGFEQFTFSIKNYPLKTLEIVDKINSREFSGFFAKLGTYFDYHTYTKFPPSDIRPVKIPYTIIHLNAILRYMLQRNFKKGYGILGFPQKIIKLISSISKKIDYSDNDYRGKMVKIRPFGEDFGRISTKEYINLLDCAIRFFDQEDDIAKGVDNAYFLLRGLAIEFKGLFPKNPNTKILVLSLFFICKYYVEVLYVQDSLEIETADPLMLSFLFALRNSYHPIKSLFYSLWLSYGIAYEMLDRLEGRMVSILSVYGRPKRCRSLLPIILKEEIDEKDKLEFRIYLRLVFCRLQMCQIKKIP